MPVCQHFPGKLPEVLKKKRKEEKGDFSKKQNTSNPARGQPEQTDLCELQTTLSECGVPGQPGLHSETLFLDRQALKA